MEATESQDDLATDHKSSSIQPSQKPEDLRERSSFLQAAANSLVLLIGLGTLSSSYAIEKSGYLGLLLLFLTSAAFWTGSKLLCKCMDDDRSLGTYQDIACKAFPRTTRAHIFIKLLFYLRVLGTLIGYMISMSDTVEMWKEDSELQILGFLKGKAIAFLVLLPTTWFRKLSTISYLTFWCGISTVITTACLFIAATTDNIGFHHKIVLVGRPINVPIATGVFSFTFGSTPVLPNIYSSMRNSKKFSAVLILTFSLAVALNVMIGLTGALMFGSAAKAQIHLNLPRHLLASKIAIWSTFFTPVTQFAMLLSPIATELETLMLNKVLRPKSRFGFLTCLLLRTSLLLAIASASLLFPFFVNIIQLIGSSLNLTLCVILPTVFYHRIFCTRMRRWQILGLRCLAILGAGAGIAGTAVSIADLQRKK